MSDWLGTSESAEYLGIHLRTLYRLIDHGRIPAYRMGRVIRLRLADLEQFIADSRVEPGELVRHYRDPDPWEVVTDGVEDGS